MKYSVIVCTFKPELTQLETVLKSIVQQSLSVSEFEVIVVDNASPEPISQSPLQQQFPGIRFIEEKQPGLVYARLKGLEYSSGDTLVYVDDDNVLDPHYLKALKELEQQHVSVAVWGPGKIKVVYTDTAPAWIRKYYSPLFQEKNSARTQYGCVAGWPSYYPAGSGMAVKREIMQTYQRNFREGQLSLTGRTGNDLSSGEDAQIVWTAVLTGKPVGTSPALQLDHLIPGRRCSLTYLCKLNYGIAYSYAKGIRETFPESFSQFRPHKWYSSLALLMRQALRAKFHPLTTWRLYQVEKNWFKGVNDLLKQPA